MTKGDPDQKNIFHFLLFKNLVVGSIAAVVTKGEPPLTYQASTKPYWAKILKKYNLGKPCFLPQRVWNFF